MAAALLSMACADAADPADAAAAPSPSPTPEDAGVPCGNPGEQLLVLSATTNIEGCEWVRGSMHVPDWFAATLPLEKIRRVDEGLSFFRPHHLSNFRGLDRLEKVGGEFSIRLDNASELVSLDGLEALRDVGGLRIDENGGLADLSGLSGLTIVHGDLFITGNRALPAAQIDKLLSHVRVEGATHVMDNGP
jgi:hypothetical protein